MKEIAQEDWVGIFLSELHEVLKKSLIHTESKSLMELENSIFILICL